MAQVEEEEHFKLISTIRLNSEQWTYQYMQYNIYCISGRQTRCNIVVIVWDVIEYYTKNINSVANITKSVLIRLAMHHFHNYEVISYNK